jgi:hypothetical protein
LQVFDPVARALNLMQSRTTTLACATQIWLDLIRTVPRNIGGRDEVLARSKQALDCPFFLLANILDPRFAGADLTAAHVDKARQFAEEEGAEVASALNLYLTRSPPFRATLFDARAVYGIDPIVWWKAGLLSGFPSALVAVALRLCSCLATTASLERAFSTMGHVYGRRRANLGVEKAGKLTFLFRRFNPSDAEASDHDDSDSE